MLFQSHIRPTADKNVYEIHLLPALPKAWPNGAVTGLRARGGHQFDFAWDNGKVTKVTLRSKLGNPLKLRVGDKVIDVKTDAGKTYTFDGQLVASH
jgi:alpha-L-fucosidase 2